MSDSLPKKSKKGRRASHNRATNKYGRQFDRTAKNKERKGVTNKKPWAR